MRRPLLLCLMLAACSPRYEVVDRAAGERRPVTADVQTKAPALMTEAYNIALTVVPGFDVPTARANIEAERVGMLAEEHIPGAMVIARSSKESRFACEVGEEHDILSISINQLVEENIPHSWLDAA